MAMVENVKKQEAKVLSCRGMIRHLLNKLIWAILFFVLFFTPLALASTQPTSLFIVQVTILTGFFLWFLRSFFFDGALTWLQSPVNPCLLAFLGIAFLPLIFPRYLSSLLHQSFYSHATIEALFKGMSYCALFWLILNFIKSEKQISLLVRAIFILGFAASLLGIIQKLSQADKVFWLYPVVVDGRPFTFFFSTFINANHFASFIGMVALLLLGRFLYLNAKYSVSGEKKHQEEKIFMLFVLVVSSAALFVSLCRGGCVIFTLSIFIFYQVILGGEKKKHSGILITLFTVSTAVMLLWIGLESILAELSTLFKPSDDVSLSSRLILWQASFLKLFLTHPLLGTGLGTFQYVFPTVQPATAIVYGSWRHVHNDWLEFLLETGIAGFFLVLFILFLFLREVWPTRSHASDPYIKYNGAGALAAISYMLMMELYDFPLRTTVCAVYFAIIAALAIRLRRFQDETDGVDRFRVIPLQGKGKRLAVGAAALLFFIANLSGLARPYLALRQIQIGGKSSLPDLEQAIRLDPLNADYHFWYGLALGEKAFYGKRQYDREQMKKAMQAIQRAIELNPGAGKYEYGLSVLAQRMGNLESAEYYFQKTLAKNPSNPFFLLYYAIFCFNQATVENVLYETDMMRSDIFKKGLEAYQKAKKILPSASLAEYKDYLAGYDKLNQLLHEKGILEPNALL